MESLRWQFQFLVDRYYVLMPPGCSTKSCNVVSLNRQYAVFRIVYKSDRQRPTQDQSTPKANIPVQ